MLILVSVTYLNVTNWMMIKFNAILGDYYQVTDTSTLLKFKDYTKLPGNYYNLKELIGDYERSFHRIEEGEGSEEMMLDSDISRYQIYFVNNRSYYMIDWKEYRLTDVFPFESFGIYLDKLVNEKLNEVTSDYTTNVTDRTPTNLTVETRHNSNGMFYVIIGVKGKFNLILEKETLDN